MGATRLILPVGGLRLRAIVDSSPPYFYLTAETMIATWYDESTARRVTFRVFMSALALETVLLSLWTSFTFAKESSSSPRFCWNLQELEWPIFVHCKREIFQRNREII